MTTLLVPRVTGRLTMVRATATHPRKFARLSFADGEIIVSPRDRDIFLINAEKATESCRNAVRLDRRIERFELELLTPLHDWCSANAAKVRACYIPIPGRQIQVFVVTRSQRFDFEFAEKVAELELQIASFGWRIGISQLPDADDGSLAAFFNPDGALEVYAESGSTPDQGGA